MTRAKVALTQTHRAQHPRMLSSSSLSSISSSSSSSCSLSPGPPQKTSTTTTTTIKSITARKRSSWMLSHHEKPGWEDTTTITPFEGPQQHQNYNDHNGHGSPTLQHTHQQRHQKSGSCDQVVPTTSPHSPPSSPLPLSLHKQNGVTDTDATTLAREVAGMDSEDDHRRRYKQHPTGRVVQGRTSAASDYSSGHDSARSAMQVPAESATAARSRRKETGGSTRTTTTTTPEIPSRPRFSLSTVVNPRPQVCSAGTAPREVVAVVPKDVSTKTTTARSSRTVKESVATPRVTKSTTSSLGGHVQPTTKSVSNTRISKSRSPTTITTTTTTTTRRVASTTITMGPHLDREHRKLAVSNASAVAASAHSTKKSPSSRKERTTRASNLSPATTGAGRATTSREGERKTGVEPIVEHTNTVTIPTSTGHNDNKNATMEHLDIAEPTTTTTTILLPALEMKGERESPAVIECSRIVQDITSPTKFAINSPSSKSSSPSSSPPAASADIPPLILSSPIIVASRPKTPPPPYQTAILHNTPSSAMVRKTPDTPSITACSPTKETTPISQEQQEHTEVYLAKPPTAVMTTPLSKSEKSPVAGSAQSPRIAKSMAATTVVSAPPTFLSGTPRILRVMRETSSPRVLGVQQQQSMLNSQSDMKVGGDQERPAEISTTPVPTTIPRSKCANLNAGEPMETRSTLPTALTSITIPDLVGAEEAPKLQPQPFRKNIWNGRMDRVAKPWGTPLFPEEAIPTTQGNAPARTGILASMGASVSRAPLTKIKDPAVMRDLMVLAKERRASRTLCDGVAEDEASGFRSSRSGENQFRDRSRMQFEHRNSNDNDTLTTTTTNFTTNHKNTCSSLSTSAPSVKITFEDKKAFLKTQEMRRQSNLHRSRSLTTAELPYYHFPASPSPAPAQDSISIDTHPGFPWKGRVATPSIAAMSVTIPLKVATVLQGMGYPINNTNNTSATSPICSSPSPAPSPTWSTPSTPRTIPSSLSSSSLSSFSSASTASSSVSSVSSMSSASSASSKTLPLSFPDRLFQTRSLSSSTRGTPAAMKPRPVRSTSITGVSRPSYSTQTYNNNQTPPQSSTMLPSLPSPALSLAFPERQRVSNRSVEGFLKPRLFSGCRSEDDQESRQHTLRPFERPLVQQQKQQHQQQNNQSLPQRAAAGAGVHAPWSSSVINSNSIPQHFPPPLPPSPSSSPSSFSITDQDDSTTDSDRERRVHERSASTTSIDRPFFTEQVISNQSFQEDEHSCLTTTTQPVTQDISFLTKRLANLQLMDSLCPVSTATPTEHLLPQQQQQQGGMDATWAMQIQLLLTHLAEQTDIEQESRPRPLPPPPRPHSLLLPLSEEEPKAGQKKKVEGMGLYKQVLTDWLLRLDQLSTITSPSTGSSLYKDHSGLKREIEKIRWQHNVPSKLSNRSK
ncbi:hypothetical protein K457DRAFT_565837 [Linnemannia elongata AG-77]|uniref:Uncharacterized protein n=1 Tax=Linnemannia elongata AG-77 TaxID=1314771 RepID=A0A197JV66_9FUNG|nr:hypothetical protein K457DRAFT_565837 [Linnemannia elongata AG-77]